MVSMLFQVLGPLRLMEDDREIDLRSRRRRVLLVSLLVHAGEVVAVSRLVDILWGGDPPGSARQSLQSHVSRLRSTLRSTGGAPQRVFTRGSGYVLTFASGDEFDATRFEEEVTSARTRLADQPDRALRLLESALGRWRGPAFADVPDAEPVRAEAVRLEQLRREATDARVEALLVLDRHDDVVGELEARVCEHPLREVPVRQLMVALFRAGRQVEALEAFRDYRERLADELGIDPSPELTRLHQRVLQQDPQLQATVHRQDAGDALARREVGVPLAPVRAVSSFVGRDGMVGSVSRLLTDVRLLTLTGPGGVGKTRLAAEVAAHTAERFDDGVVTVELAPIREADALEHAVAGALDVIAGRQDVREALVSALQGRRLLLVVDNCEHLVPAVADLVDDLLRRCPTLTVLATSRERLAVDGEHLWRVPPLDLPRSGRDLPVEEIAESPAVRLFAERAAAVAHGFSLTDGNIEPVVRVCTRLDGLPLAVELAAARLAAMSVHEVAERLDHRFRILAGGPRHDSGRHRTLREVVDWSYSLLDSQEARLFDRLSVFLGGFTLEAAEHVCAVGDLQAADVTQHLPGLVDKSMVLRTGTRYDLLETLRLYGAERLDERGQIPTLRRAHAGYFAGLAETAGRAVTGPDEADWVHRIDDEVDNLRAAHRWALVAGEAELALRLSAPLAFYADWRSRGELLSWAEQAASMPSAHQHALEPMALAAAARGASDRGQLDRAGFLAGRGLEAAPDPDDPRRVPPLRALGLVAFFQGRLQDSQRLQLEVLRTAQAAGDLQNVIEAWAMQALIAAYSGDQPRAVDAAERACHLADDLGNVHMRALARYCRGEALTPTEADEALADLEESVALARLVGARLIEGVALVSIGSIRAERDEPAAALEALRRAVERWRRSGDWTHQWTTLRNLAFLLVRLGEDETAATLLGAAQTTTTSPRVYGGDADRLRESAELLRRRLGDERYERAWSAGAHQADHDTVAFALRSIDGIDVDA